MFDEANATVLYSNTSSTIEHINNSIKVISGQTSDSAFVTTKVCDIENLINKTVTVKGNWTGSNSGTILIGYCNKDGSNRVTLGEITTSINFTSITIPEGKEDKVLILWFYTGGNINGYVDYTNVQVEYGSTATEYVERKEQTFTFPLGTQKMFLGDYLADDGIHHKTRELNLATADMNNDENYPGWKNLSQLKTDYPSISDSFTAAGINYKSNISNEAYRFRLNTLYEGVMWLPPSNWGNIKQTQWKTNYPNLILKFQYELKEEEVVPYTSAQQRAYNEIKNAYSYDEMTIITGSSDGNKPFFTVQAYKDLNKELNNKVDEEDLTDYVKNTDYAQSNKGGTIKKGNYLNVNNSGTVFAEVLSYELYSRNDVENNIFIGKGTLENVIAGKQLINQTQLEESQETQDEEIEKLQEENARLKATLPTTTGEGKEVTLNKTAELEFKKPPLPMGNSEQESTTGKNLLPNIATSKTEKGITVTRNKDGSIIVNGTATEDVGIVISNNFDLPSGTYIISGCPTGGSTSTYRIMMWNSSWSYISQDIGNSGTFTLENDTTNNKISIQVYSGTTINNLVFKPMIRLASITDDTYEPYTNGASPNPDYPQEITNVTGDVEVVVENKNLLDMIEKQSYTENGITVTNNKDGSFTLNGTNTKSRYIDLYITPNTNSQTIIKDLENGTYLLKIYELSGNINFNSENCYVIVTGRGENNQQLNSMMEIALHNNKQYHVKSLEGCKLTTVKFYIGPGITFNNYRFKIMMTKSNDTSLPYVEHKHQTFTFPLGNEKLMLGDYLADDGIHHVKRQVVFDGSESWGNNGETSDYGQYLLLINDKKYGATNIISNKFITKQSLAENSIAGRSNSNYIAITVDKKIIPYSKDNLKTWLSTHNVMVEYELAEEVIVPYTSAQQEVYNQIKQALSYEEQTNISSNTIALFNVEAYQSTKLVLQEKDAKYESLEARVALLE